MPRGFKQESFGMKLKRLREAQGLTLKELALQLNLKPAYLEKLEQDEVLPPVAEIITIARHLSVEPSTFMSGTGAGPLEEKRKRAIERRTQDYAYQLLAPLEKEKAEHHLMAFEVRIEPESFHRKVAYRHTGEEFIYVLSGKLEITIDRKKKVLTPRECIHFDSSKKHILRNPGKEEARLLVVIYTP